MLRLELRLLIVGGWVIHYMFIIAYRVKAESGGLDDIGTLGRWKEGKVRMKKEKAKTTGQQEEQ